ncbi:MAG: arsenosugar biosynthesis radical SAM protein ArsS [Synergistaceae bacterium]|nr:arsenosugar biosynthesis radical SAM protein ArsS [Synergistaceae bacterium]
MIDMIEPFENMIKNPALKMTEENLKVLQVNVGKLCNLACKHCHVGANPNSTEIMTRDTMQQILRILPNFKTLDITGGSPEMNPNFRWFVDEASKICSNIMVRSNLVIMTEENYKDIPDFLKGRKVEIIASLPYYTENDCDRQRGKGTFRAVISMLKKLNSIGYGINEELSLNLVYNPGGAFLSPSQNELEQEYKKRLRADYGIEFTHLFAITNNPIGRFKEFLKRTNNYERYMKRLYDAFNPDALKGMMCRFQLSVSWDGKLYDCDFNQPLNLMINGVQDIRELKEIHSRKIKFGNHCYACTAGSGSSCGGATT